MAPAPKSASEGKFEHYLKYSEQKFREPLDLLQGDSLKIEQIPAEMNTYVKPAKKPVAGYYVQLGAFRIKENAFKYIDVLHQQLGNENIDVVFYNEYWRILSKRFATHEEAERLRDTMKRQGFWDAWILRIE